MRHQKILQIEVNGMEKPQQTYSFFDYMKFVIPSIIGIFLFMIPISYNGDMTIPVALMAGWVEDWFIKWVPPLMIILISVTLTGTLITLLAKPKWVENSPFLTKLLNVSSFWLIIRMLSLVFVIMTFYQWGPEWIWSENTGDLILSDLIPMLFAVFLFAGLFLPLLLNFGLLEFFGTLFVRIMRPIFTLPGRSSIDCLASWLGDGTIGVLLTNKQYEEGFYTKREAAVIGTTFSVVSITFTIVILKQVKLEHLFFPYYLTIALAGLAAALIMPRIPPLSRKPDTNYDQATEKADETIPSHTTPFRWGLRQAASRAQNNRFVEVAKGGVQNVLDMWLGVIPVVMTFGTVALVLAEYTPVFRYLGTPFVPLLTLLQVPEAGEAAQTMVVGFADMFLPAVIGSGIESELTRFVIACVSVVQLIYMSEVGGLLLGSKIPVNVWDLIVIFLLRTLITLPIIVLMAHLII
nr:YjiH family protein [Kroppenstedtia pulmonis]